MQNRIPKTQSRKGKGDSHEWHFSQGGWHCGRRVISDATAGLFSRAVWNWLKGSFSHSDGRLCTAGKPGYCCGGSTILGMCSGITTKAVSRSRWPSMARSMLSAGIPRQMSLVNGGQR